MELTKITKKNREAFSPLLYGVDFSDFSFAVGAVEEDQAAGVALFNYLGDALMLDYIYVSEKFRRRGIATSLVTEFLMAASLSTASALHINYPEVAEDLHGFALSMGFRLFRDGQAYEVPVKSFLTSKKFKALIQGDARGRVVSFGEISGAERKLLKKEIDKQRMDENIIDDKSVDKELSFVSWDDRNNKPAACVICEQNHEQITVLYLANFSGSPARLVDVLRALREAIEKKNLEDYNLLFVTMNEDMIKLAKTLTSTVEGLEPACPVISGIMML